MHRDFTTLSAKGRVSLSPELPESLRQLVLEKLSACLKGAVLTPQQEKEFLAQMAAHYQPGMPEQAFLLRTAAAIPAWAQHLLAETLQQSEPRRRHIRLTLSRCIPACVVTEDMVTRCERLLGDAAWDTGDIIRFAAAELLDDPQGKHPLMHRLHQSAMVVLNGVTCTTRDDLRLITLHALFKPSLLPQPYAGYLFLRLGKHTGCILSAEEVAAATHLPVTYIREVEEGTLQYLLTTINREVPHA